MGTAESYDTEKLSSALPSSDTLNQMTMIDVLRLTTELLGPQYCPRLEELNMSGDDAAGSSFAPAAQAEIAAAADEYREVALQNIRFLPNHIGLYDQIGIKTVPLTEDSDINLLGTSSVTEMSQRDLLSWERALRVNVGIMSLQDFLLAGVLKVFQKLPQNSGSPFVGEGLVSMVDSVADSMRSSARLLQNVVLARRDAFLSDTSSLPKEKKAELRGLPIQGNWLFNGDIYRVTGRKSNSRSSRSFERHNVGRLPDREEDGQRGRGGDRGNYVNASSNRRTRSPPGKQSPPRSRRRSPPRRHRFRSRSPQRPSRINSKDRF